MLIIYIITVGLWLSYYKGSALTVTCYYESWTDLAPEDIDVSICNRINFAFLRINDDGSFRLDEGENEDTLKRLGALKSKHPDLSLLVTVGGWGEDSPIFSKVAKDANRTSNMAISLLNYMTAYNFNGIDFDWEFPGQNGGAPDDKDNFIVMLSAVRRALDDYGGGLITVAVSSYPDSDLYNVNAMSNVVDAINVMTFDFHGSSIDTKTGENSPLYSSSTDSEWERHYANCDAAINNWLNGGAHPSKLFLGLAFYGHNFTLTDPKEHNVGAAITSANDDYTAYNEICQLTYGWSEEWDNEQQVPYIYLGNQWIGYDNARSIALKVKYAKTRNLGGVMLWAVDYDDNYEVCGSKNPLLQAIKNSI